MQHDIKHKQSNYSSTIREVVFGMEDGMVSTLGAVTGILAGTQDQFTVLLAGSVIIAVESVAMGVGSYISSKSEREVEESLIANERIAIETNPQKEKVALYNLYKKEGWPEPLAIEMSEHASTDKELFISEISCKGLRIINKKQESPIKNALYMWSSYIIGGLIPLSTYFFLPTSTALVVSIVVTLFGLFMLGAATTKFTKRKFFRAGIEMLLLASAAALIGYTIGRIFNLAT